MVGCHLVTLGEQKWVLQVLLVRSRPLSTGKVISYKTPAAVGGKRSSRDFVVLCFWFPGQLTALVCGASCMAVMSVTDSVKVCK